jgi:TolB-like protein/Tfp pilus assembly protein PilF
VLVVAAALIAGGNWWMRPMEPASASTSIAVLPFDNLGGDEQTGRLADGITEDIIADLARFRDLVVIARNSVEIYKDNAVDIRQVGRDLSVRFVLEGSIQRQGDRFRVTAQLIEAASGAHVWSERWDRPVDDIFAVQTEVAERIASSFGGHGLITEADRSTAKRKRPENLTAYELYLFGVEMAHVATSESLEEAIRLLGRAVELDPQFARAWAELYWAYHISAEKGRNPSEYRKAAFAAARRAVQADPMDAAAHVALGNAFGNRGDLQQAKVHYDRALQLNPNHTTVLNVNAAWASTFNAPEKGAEIADRLVRLDPSYPMWAANGIGYAYFMAGRYEDALQAVGRITEEARRPEDFIHEAGALAGLDRLAEANAVVKKALTWFPDISIEAQIGRPDFIEHERQRFIETMRKAGFPICANEKVLKESPNLIRMPECLRS